MIAKIKLYLRRTIVLLLNMIAWCVGGAAITLFWLGFAQVFVPFFFILIDWQFGTDLVSPILDLFGEIEKVSIYSGVFFGVLGGFLELFYPKSSTRTTTLDEWGLDWNN